MPHPIHLIYGEERFLIETRTKELKDTYKNASLDIFQSTQSLQDLLTLSSSIDMFASQKLIFAESPSFLYNALSDKELKMLEQTISNIITNNHILLISCQTKKPDMRKKAPQLIKKQGQAEEFQSFKSWEQDKVYAWIQNHTKKQDATIERDAVMALEEVGGQNLHIMATEITTLLTYIHPKTTITKSDILSLSADTLTTTFELTDAIKTKNSAHILKFGRLLNKNGEDPIKLMGLITSNLRLFFQILDGLDNRDSIDAIAKKLKKNAYYIKKLVPEIKKNHTTNTLKRQFIKLAKLDLSIKTGQIKPKIALDLALFEVGH